MAQINKTAITVSLFALLCWSCGSDTAKKPQDTAAAVAADGHDHSHEVPGVTAGQADSIIGKAGRSTDTVNLVALPPVQEGDIVFQDAPSAQCRLAGKATGWKYNHMGVIFIRPKNGEYAVMEAFDTTRLFPLREWVDRGEGKHVRIMRLKNSNKIITEKKLERLKKAARQFHKKPFDPYFGWSDDALYAAELVWKIYHEALALRLGELKKMQSLNLSDPELKKLLTTKYGGAIPMNEDVITPKDIAECSLLETVFEK